MNSKDRYDSLFQCYGEKYGVSWRLLKAQALAESGLDPDARSRVGALGLTQFMPATFNELAERQGWKKDGRLLDARDPEDAIMAQAAYMGWLLKECRDMSLALAAYNWGIGRVKRTFLDPGKPYDEALVPDETKGYVKKIAATLREMTT